MKKIIVSLFIIFFLGCVKETKSIHLDKNLLDIMDKNISINEKELYFAKTKDKKFYKKNEKISYQKGWIEIDIKTNNNNTKKFEIMISPVSEKMFYNKNSNKPVTNIPFEVMNEFCIKHNAFLISPYVFDVARRKKLIHKPSNGINSEIIAPIDEDDEDNYLHNNDNIISKEGTIIKFDWNKEKYYEVPEIFTSNKTTFRCMKIK